MTFEKFLELYEANVQKLTEENNTVGLSGKAYELTEKQHIEVEGKRKYKHFNSFSAGRCIRNDKKDRIAVEKKNKPVSAYKRNKEFESKYNWLTGYSYL